MKLCMFHPVDRPMVRGWVGRIDGEHVVHLAAQTLESFFTGGGSAREHAVYPLDAVRLLPPVLHPPSIRVFESEKSFAFANPAAVVGPDATITSGDESLTLLPRLAAVIGRDGALAGFTAFAEWRRPDGPVPKDRDFALGLGPVVLTWDEMPDEVIVDVRVDRQERLRQTLSRFPWNETRDFAGEGTTLRPGDLLVAPAPGSVEDVRPAQQVELELAMIGTLRQRVA